MAFTSTIWMKICTGIMAVGLAAAPSFAQTTTAKTSTKTTKSSTPANNASDSDIAAAQKDGKVWVNTETGVYHKSGRYYGKTKKGKFMTEDEAKKAGFHAAKQEVGTKK